MLRFFSLVLSLWSPPPSFFFFTPLRVQETNSSDTHRDEGNLTHCFWYCNLHFCVLPPPVPASCLRALFFPAGRCHKISLPHPLWYWGALSSYWANLCCQAQLCLLRCSCFVICIFIFLRNPFLNLLPTGCQRYFFYSYWIWCLIEWEPGFKIKGI